MLDSFEMIKWVMEKLSEQPENGLGTHIFPIFSFHWMFFINSAPKQMKDHYFFSLHVFGKELVLDIYS